MKRLLCFLLLGLLLSGCSGHQEQYTFYYPATEEVVTTGTESTLIVPEYRETAAQKPELKDLLQLYLEGPEDPKHRNPFPAGLRLLQVTREQGTLVLELSEEFLQLEGIQLTLAKGCLAATCQALADVEKIMVSCGDIIIPVHLNEFSFLDPDPREG